MRSARSLAVLLAALFINGASVGRADEIQSIETLRTAGAKLTESKGAVTGCEIADAATITIEQLQLLDQLPQLKSLSFGKGLSDEMLAKLPPLANLESFSSNASTATDDGIKALARYRKLRSIALFHPGKQFSGSGLAALAELPQLDRLTVAGSLAFDDTGMAAVGQLTHLQNFRTWHTGVTNEGVKKLASLPKLESLVVGQRLAYKGEACPSDDTMAILAQFKSLKTLDLQEARLSRGALEKLKALTGLKTLKLSGVEIAEVDLSQLKQELPGVEITRTEPSEAFQKRIQALFSTR